MIGNRVYKVAKLPTRCRCGADEGYIVPRDPHIGLYCLGCDSWVKWVAKRDVELVALAGQAVERAVLIADEAWQPPLLAAEPAKESA